MQYHSAEKIKQSIPYIWDGIELCENEILYISKCELEILLFLYQLLIYWIYAVGLKLLNLEEVSHGK